MAVEAVGDESDAHARRDVILEGDLPMLDVRKSARKFDGDFDEEEEEELLWLSSQVSCGCE